jgi:hypothetical protein
MLRSTFTLFAFVSLLLSGVAFAQQPGNTSGSASGTNVQPSTSIQKENMGPRVRAEGPLRTPPALLV